MKILLISNMFPNEEFPFYGTFVRNFEKGLINEGIAIEKVVLYKKKNAFTKICSYIKFFFKIFIKYFKDDFDLVYIHYPTYSGLPFIGMVTKKKIVLNYHGSDLIYQNFRQKILGRIVNSRLTRKASYIVVPSEYYKNILIQMYNYISEKSIIVSPSGGVNTQVFKPNNLCVNNKKFVIGFVSRINRNKGWEIFLDALSLISEIEFEAIIVGMGEDEEKLKQKIDEHRFKNSISYLGPKSQEDLVALYNSFDIFVFPSKQESLGLVGLEAMACGVPVIGSNIPAITSYIIDGYNGYLFNCEDKKSLAEKIMTYYNLNDNEKISIKKNALEKSLSFDAMEVNRKLAKKIRDM